MSTTTHRLVPALALVAATPAFACGGPSFTTTQAVTFYLALFAAPLLGVLLVDRGAFALAAHARGLARKHRPTALGPILALAAVFVGIAGVFTRDVDLGIVGASIVPVAAIICGLSFVRSVIIEQRGQPRAQLLRAGAVLFVSALTVLTFMMH